MDLQIGKATECYVHDPLDAFLIIRRQSARGKARHGLRVFHIEAECIDVSIRSLNIKVSVIFQMTPNHAIVPDLQSIRSLHSCRAYGILFRCISAATGRAYSAASAQQERCSKHSAEHTLSDLLIHRFLSPSSIYLPNGVLSAQEDNSQLYRSCQYPGQ